MLFQGPPGRGHKQRGGSGQVQRGALHPAGVDIPGRGRYPAGGAAGGRKKSWLFYAAGSAVFASLTSILGKAGITGVESNLGTAIRTGVVLVMAWAMVFITGKAREVSRIPQKELGFIALSGICTGASWLCYYRALQEGPASVVAPIDKLSILVTAAFSYIVFHEKLTKKSGAGLAAIVWGTLIMLAG